MTQFQKPRFTVGPPRPGQGKFDGVEIFTNGDEVSITLESWPLPPRMFSDGSCGCVRVKDEEQSVWRLTLCAKHAAEYAGRKK